MNSTGQLTGVDEPFGVSLTFDYDAAGNRTQVTDSLGGVETSAFDGDNRLIDRSLTVGGHTIAVHYTYDGDGHVTLLERTYDGVAAPTTVYAYDAANNSTSTATRFASRLNESRTDAKRLL